MRKGIIFCLSIVAACGCGCSSGQPFRLGQTMDNAFLSCLKSAGIRVNGQVINNSSKPVYALNMDTMKTIKILPNTSSPINEDVDMVLIDNKWRKIGANLIVINKNGNIAEKNM